ncbi:type II secretion system protein [Planctomicrobium sp. SH668]|uniref:type II secretion system protein n=1 Tax=Planctomicrobium sp. SH668 TaxID=3448126 RepID=UPI003F5B3938
MNNRFPTAPRSGLTLVEVLIVLSILALLACLGFPWLQSLREQSRQAACRDHLRTLTMALHQYEEVHQFLPVAARWNEQVGESMLLHESKHIDLITMENWAILLLPFLSQPEMVAIQDHTSSIGSAKNLAIRTTSLPVMTCSSDSYSTAENKYDFLPPGRSLEAIQFARGSYAINGGTQNPHPYPPSTISPRGDQHVTITDISTRRYQKWNNGIMASQVLIRTSPVSHS